MSVRIRLSRIGKKHVPFYRVVAVDKRKKRDGACLEELGTYDAIKGIIVRFDEEAYTRRVNQGAIASDAAKKIYMMFKAESAPVAPKVEKTVKKAAAKKTESKEVQAETTE